MEKENCKTVIFLTKSDLNSIENHSVKRIKRVYKIFLFKTNTLSEMLQQISKFKVSLKNFAMISARLNSSSN